MLSTLDAKKSGLSEVARVPSDFRLRRKVIDIGFCQIDFLQVDDA